MAVSPVKAVILPQHGVAPDEKLFFRSVRDNFSRIINDSIVRWKGAPAYGHVRMTANANDGDTVTVTVSGVAVIYEFDNDASITAGNISVTIGGSAATSAANLATAITANQPLAVSATQHATDTTVVDILALESGASFSLATNAAARITVQDNGGEMAEDLLYLWARSYTVTAEDVSRGRVRFETGFDDITYTLFRIRTSTSDNTEIGWTGTASTSGGAVEFPIAGGEPAAGRRINLWALGT